VKETTEDLRNQLHAVNSQFEEATRQRDELLKELTSLKFSAAASAKARAEFLGTLCHDFRQGLHGIIGFSDLLISEEIAPISVQKRREYVRDIRNGGEHLLALTKDILDLVNYDAGKLQLSEDLIDIDQFIKDTLRLVPGAARDEVAVIWKPGSITLPRLYCDPVRVRQILLNVVGNALKFTKPGGHVDLTVEISEGLTFVVTDTGVGIKKEDITRILTPFERVQSAYSRSPEAGLGLGLPLAKVLMEAHGGLLTLNSTLRVGTTVRLWFPSERIHLGSTHDVEDLPTTTGRGTILVVEDDPLTAKFTRDVLQQHGYNILLARIGQAALDLAREKCPDLILMDIGLPDISGLEAVYWLRSEARTAQIPIVGTTCFPIPERWVLAGGCDAFIPKAGSTIPELLRRIDEVVDSGRSESIAGLTEQRVDTRKIITDLVEYIDVITGPHEVVVSWRPDKHSIPNLLCDLRWLRKILWSTISYAALEINQGGKIKITTDTSEGFAVVIEHNQWSNEAGEGFDSAKALIEQNGGRLSRLGGPDLGTRMRISFPPERVCTDTLH
jgi:CheY-like chemotaxis protein/nitrogen-specific signal transduction histidine kinase